MITNYKHHSGRREFPYYLLGFSNDGRDCKKLWPLRTTKRTASSKDYFLGDRITVDLPARFTNVFEIIYIYIETDLELILQHLQTDF